MSDIHYFPRYRSAENFTTNNTLLLLGQFNRIEPKKYATFIADLLGNENLAVGHKFSQQTKAVNSIPDGGILQQSFRAVIETKMYESQFTLMQLENHLKAFEDEQMQIMLSLSPKPMAVNLSNSFNQKVDQFNRSNKKRISFVEITFSDIIQKFRDSIEEYDIELIELIDDYEDFCAELKLLPTDEFKMLAVPCGLTLQENFDYGIYYDPATRNFSPHAYLGIYKNKAIRGIGKVINVVEANMVNNSLIIINQSNDVTDEQKERIENIMAAALQNHGWDITNGHKFFIVDRFHETNFEKKTKYPLQGRKYFNLKNILKINQVPDTSIISDLLRNEDW